MKKSLETSRQVVRVDGKLKEILIIKDQFGNVLHKFFSPLMLEFYPRDVVQVIVGAAVLAIPVSFTEEVWNMASSLPQVNVYAVATLSLMFIAIFVYYNFYRGNMKEHFLMFLKRVIFIYIISLLVVAIILSLIQVAPWHSDLQLAVNRIILVAFPASMSGAIADMIK